jgi:hypothetical protein
LAAAKLLAAELERRAAGDTTGVPDGGREASGIQGSPFDIASARATASLAAAKLLAADDARER